MAATDSILEPRYRVPGLFRRRVKDAAMAPPGAVKVGQMWDVYSADHRAWQKAVVTRVDGQLVIMRDCGDSASAARDDTVTMAKFMLSTPGLYRYAGG